MGTKDELREVVMGENKSKEKEIHNLNRNLENTRATLKSCKAEKSQLKMNKTKLETEIRKLERRCQKERKETAAKSYKSDNKDFNENVNVQAEKPHCNHECVRFHAYYLNGVTHFSKLFWRIRATSKNC